MGFAERMYRLSPMALQHAQVSAYGWYWKRRRFGGVFADELDGYLAREHWNADAWTAYQTDAMRCLLAHAYEKVPWYRRTYDASGIDGRALSRLTIDQLGHLPILSKQDLRLHCAGDLLANKRERGGSFFSSSGSTGTPVRILFSTPMHQRWSAAFEARIRRWAGLHRHMRRGMIGGRRVVPEAVTSGPVYRYNAFEHQVYFSAYHISPGHLPSYIDGMRRFAIDYMTGYAASLALLARMLEDAGMHPPAMKAVVTSSEKLTPDMRAVIERVFQCRCYDSWSGVEACGLITECEEGSLHVSPDVAILEVVDEQDRTVPPGVPGELLCTGFLNTDQPLIRYRIGDRVTMSSTRCACGRSMPVVEEIHGRVEDVIVGPDGRRMVRFHGIFIDIPGLVEAQVVQHSVRDIQLRVVVDSHWQEENTHIMKKRVRSQLGDVTVAVDIVDSIPRNRSGKFQAVISRVSDSQSA